MNKWRKINPSLNKWVQSIFLISGSVFFLFFLYSVIHRIGYPFDLEWMEGMLVTQTKWLMAGHDMYAAPSIKFTPGLYAPVYFWVSRLLSTVISNKLLAMRLVTVACTIATMGLVGAIVNKETKNKTAGLAAAFWVTALYQPIGYWFDLARVDMLFVALCSSVIFLLKYHSHQKTYLIIAGLLTALAGFTKQTTAFWLFPLALAWLFQLQQRPKLFYITLGAAPTTLFLAWKTGLLTNSWAIFYLIKAPFAHPWMAYMHKIFWLDDVLLTIPLLWVGSLVLIFKKAKTKTYFWPLVFVGALWASYSSRLHSGGYQNVLIPLYLMCLVLTAILLAKHAKGWLNYLFLLGIGVQAYLLVYNPMAIIPNSADYQANQNVTNLIKKYPAPIWTPGNQTNALKAGHWPHLHFMSTWDLLRTTKKTESNTLTQKLITDAYRAHYFKAIVTNKYILYPDSLNKYYNKTKIHFKTPFGGYPKSGFMYRPNYLYTPKPKAPSN